MTLTEPVALLLLLGVLITLERRQPLLCGVLTGLLWLTRPNAYLVALIVGVALWRWVGATASSCRSCSRWSSWWHRG